MSCRAPNCRRSIYSAADVFVLPSRCETFGLVMLEAMACGTPVAAYPVAGPRSTWWAAAAAVCWIEDLAEAARAALRIPRGRARARALQFDWSAVCDRFLDLLVPACREAGRHAASPQPAQEVEQVR